MRNKIIAAVVAGGLLVVAAFVASAVSTPAVASAEDQGDSTQGGGIIQRGVSFLQEVLSDLVGKGTINQEQADAITQAVQSKAEELKTQRQELRDEIQGFLDDGVLTEEEAAQLPDDSVFKSARFDDAWADGQLTLDEIREVLGGTHFGPRPFRRGLGWGALLDDGGIDTEEYNSLPDSNPLKQIDVSKYLDDGVITISELREIFGDLMHLPGSTGPQT